MNVTTGVARSVRKGEAEVLPQPVDERAEGAESRTASFVCIITPPRTRGRAPAARLVRRHCPDASRSSTRESIWKLQFLVDSRRRDACRPFQTVKISDLGTQISA